MTKPGSGGVGDQVSGSEFIFESQPDLLLYWIWV